jgi:hypothetical protein
VTNDYQGALRYAPLYHPDVLLAIERDLGHIDWPVTHGIAVTCLDQVPPPLIPTIVKPFGSDLQYMVSGPTRADVTLAAQPSHV